MAALAAGILGIISAGTKVALVLSQFSNEMGSADREVRIIASEIRSSCTILTTLHSTLKHVQMSPYYAHCADLIGEMTDASLEIYGEIMEVVGGLEGMIQKGEVEGAGRGEKMNLRKRVVWTFRKPEIIMLRTTLDAYRSNLALMLGTLDVAEKTTRGNAMLNAKEDERDCLVLEKLRIEQRISLLRVEEINPEDVELPQSQIELSSLAIKDEALPDEKGYVSALREEIVTMKRSRTYYDTDPEKVRNRVSRQSKRLSQLLVQDQNRISKRWSRTLPQRRLSFCQELSVDIAPSSTISGTSLASQSDSRNASFIDWVQGQHWEYDPVVSGFYSWMSTQGTAQRSLVLKQLQTCFGPSRQEIVRKPVNCISMHPTESEDTLCVDFAKQELEKAMSTTEVSEEPVLAPEVSKEKKGGFFLKRTKGLKRRTPSAL